MLKVTHTNQYTNGQLLTYHQEIQGGWDGSILTIFLAAKIREFYNQNGGRIKTLLEKQDAIKTEYFQTEKFGNGERFKADEKGHPVFREGKTKEALEKTMNEFLSESVNIIL